MSIFFDIFHSFRGLRGLSCLLACMLCMSTVYLQAADDMGSTVITSDRLEMISGKDENRFFFYGDVKVKGNNLVASCEEMEVVSSRVGGEDDEMIGQIGAIGKIILKGDVVIQQAGRTAESGHAEIFPAEGRVVLTDNPVVRDAEGTVTGHRMELIQGERVARVFGEPDGGGRPTLTLPTLPDLGYENEPAERNQ